MSKELDTENVKKRINKLIQQEGPHLKALLERINFLLRQINSDLDSDYLNNLSEFYNKTKELVLAINPQESIPEFEE